MKSKVLSTITVGSIVYGLYQKFQNLKLKQKVKDIDTFVEAIEFDSMTGLDSIQLAVNDILEQNRILSEENKKLKELIEESKKSLQ